MDQEPVFRYSPCCTAPGCVQPPLYKIAAPWSDGVSHELKNYGLACEAHKRSQLELARQHHRNLKLAEGETVGPVDLYLLQSGRRDAELSRVGDQFQDRLRAPT
jgi:hypothetical protein